MCGLTMHRQSRIGLRCRSRALGSHSTGVDLRVCVESGDSGARVAHDQSDWEIDEQPSEPQSGAWTQVAATDFTGDRVGVQPDGAQVVFGCGSPVSWVDAATARSLGMDVDEALRFLNVSSVDEVECWVCTACDNAGVMGPASAD